MDKATENLLETLVGFVNETATDVRSLEANFAGLKAGLSRMIADSVAEAKAELAVEMHSLVSESNQNAAERSARAQKELHGLEEMMTATGEKKIVRLIRDSEDRVMGGVVITH